MDAKIPNTLLFEAVETNDLAALDRALELGADPNVKRDGGNTPLFLAVVYRFDRVVARLIEAGANVHPADDEASLLALAAPSPNPEELDETDEHIVSLLIEAGADASRIDANGYSALDGSALGVSESALRIVATLLRHGADPNAASTGTTPLMDAAQTGCLSMVRLLLDHGADPNFASGDSDAPLNVARKHGHADTEALLQSVGAVEPREIQSDLRTAVVWGDAEAVAQLACVGDGDLSPLLYDAVWHWDRPALIDALLTHGADPNSHAGGEDDCSVVESAVDMKRSKTVELLLARGADPFRHGREGVMMASAGSNGDERSLSALLGKGVSVDAGDWEGTTALMMATHDGHLGTVRFLLDRGADVNRRTLNNHPDYYGGAAALLFSVNREDSSPAVIKALLDAGADIETTDAAGKHGSHVGGRFGIG